MRELQSFPEALRGWRFRTRRWQVEMQLGCNRSAILYILGMYVLPYHPLVLLLSDIRRHLAVYLARVERHGQCFRHVGLYRGGYAWILVCRADPEFCGPGVLKLARTGL